MTAIKKIRKKMEEGWQTRPKDQTNNRDLEIRYAMTRKPRRSLNIKERNPMGYQAEESAKMWKTLYDMYR